MATTTPNYGWDVPTSTDYVKDGATAIETLGDDIDASLFSITSGKNVGLVHINSTTVTGQSSFIVDNVFTSAFTNYRIVYDFSVSTNAARSLNMQFRSSGSTISTADYQSVSDGALPQGGTSRTGSFFGALNSTSLTIMPDAYYAGPNNFSFSADVINPQVAKFSNVHGNYMGQTAANLVFGNYGGSYTGTTAMDGFTFFTTSGTMTGTVRIYGYRNS
jgi:hypothetical protein